MHFSRLTSIAAAVCVLTAAAIFASTQQTQAAGNPCSLLSQSEAAKYLGTPSLPGKFEKTTETVGCRYYSPDHTKNVFLQWVSPGTVSHVPLMGGKLLPGVGDKAYWLAGSIFMQKGSTYIQVALFLSMDSMNRMDPQIVPLAKLIASRL